MCASYLFREMQRAATRKMTADELCRLPARSLARRLRERKIACVELLEAHLARIDAHNPALNAVVSLDRAGARERAGAADAALRKGKPWGPLHGVPLTLKDGHEVAGLRTTVGTRELDHVAGADGAVAARLRAAGAILLGHTNVSPWLGDYQSANPLFGRTNNPWNLERTAGGSGGGAAAAVAAGMTPIEIGSDLAGSLRIPASFCGIHSLKTTEHRVPLTGFFALPQGAPRTVRILSCLGPMARDLEDLQLALSIVAGPDGRDGDVPAAPLAAQPRSHLRGLRLAVVPALPGASLSKAIRSRIERLAAEAAEAGAEVVARLPDLDWEALHALFADLVATITGLNAPDARLRDEQRTLSWYFGALDRRDAFISQWEDFFSGLDALVLPAAMTTAFTHRDAGASIEVDGKAVRYEELGHLLVFCNLAGLPALTAPASLDDQGLPMGVQIVGPRWSEMRLLEIARELERKKILPGFQPPPGL